MNYRAVIAAALEQAGEHHHPRCPWAHPEGIDPFEDCAPECWVQRAREALLPSYAREVLDLIGSRSVTATELHEENPSHQLTVTGWNQRLENLRALGLVTRFKSGRQWFYQPVSG